VVTPGIMGEDGISCLTRQVVRALGEINGDLAPEVWSWADGEQISVPEVSGIPLRTARGKRLRLLRWAAKAGVVSQKGRLVVVLHAHLAPVALPMVARGARLVHFLVGVEVWKPLTLLQRRALLRASRLIGISRHTVGEFRRANPEFADTETVVCHPGLPSAAEEARPAAKTCEAALIVGRMAISERYKGHDTLLEVWSDVLREIPGARLVVAGDGDDQARLQAKASSLGLGRSIEFRGHVSSGALDSLYKRMCFMVMPSRGEGFGFVFLEAMRHGKPVIAGVGAGSEIVDNGRTGFVVDPGDRAALTSAVVRLFRDEDLRLGMGERARVRFNENFTSDHFRERLRPVLLDS